VFESASLFRPVADSKSAKECAVPDIVFKAITTYFWQLKESELQLLSLED
jgi:hypothetical protein